MASLSFSASTTAPMVALLPIASSSNASTSSSSSSPSSSKSVGPRCFLSPLSLTSLRSSSLKAKSRRSMVVCMAPEEEKMTRRSPLDFPIEWERPKPGRRPDIFPQFSPMKTPLPPPMPADPPEEDEEEEENKEEEEEDPEKEEQENPDKPQ